MTWLLKPYPLKDAALADALWVHPALSPQPKVVAQIWGSGAWTSWVDLDLWADRPLDTFALLFHDGPTGGKWKAYGRTDADGPPLGAWIDDPATELFQYVGWGEFPPSADGVFRDRRAHALMTLPAPRPVRYLRIYIDWPGPADLNPWNLGVIAIGKRWEPGRDTNEMRGFDWGAGWRANDQSEIRTHDGGEQSSWRRAVVPEVRGTFSHLTDAEVRELKAIIMAAGRTEPLLLVEADDTLGAGSLPQRIHYGSLIDVDFFERRDVNKRRFELRLRNWL
jgi:hypothetical protein